MTTRRTKTDTDLHLLRGMSKMIKGKRIRLREKRVTDAQDDYAWQTDPELASLDAMPVLSIPFVEYLLTYANQLLQSPPGSLRLAIETSNGKHIGNCTYYNIDKLEGEAELGIMIGDRNYWDRGYGTEAVNALLNHIFHRTNLRRVHLKTLDWNQRAQKCFSKCGFSPCGQCYRDGYNFVLMEITRHQWQECGKSAKEKIEKTTVSTSKMAGKPFKHT